MTNLSNISIFGWLEAIPLWRDLPYPVKGALLRALKGALSVGVGILLSAALAGVLFPEGINPVFVIAVTAILQGVDKFLRELKIDEEASEANADIPLTDVPMTEITAAALEAYRREHPETPVEVNTDTTVVTPADNPEEEPEVNTDATTVSVPTEDVPEITEPDATEPEAPAVTPANPVNEPPSADVPESTETPVTDDGVDPTEFDDPEDTV